MKKDLKISGIQRGTVYDGEGVRTTVFLSGCSCSCPWCCNPETVSQKEYFIDTERCEKNRGSNSKYCKDCEIEGGSASVTKCPFGLVNKTFEFYDKDTLYWILSKDFSLFKESGGGITFSGGEPFLQYSTLMPLLERLKKDNINIIFETSFNVPNIALIRTLPYVDKYIIDLKLQQETFLHNEIYLDKVRQNLEIIEDKVKCYRIVFIDTLLDVVDDVIKVLASFNIHHIQLLSCHDLAKNKYKKLGLEFINFRANKDKLESFKSIIERSNIQVSILQL